MPRIATLLKNSTLLLLILCVFYFLVIQNEVSKLPEPSGLSLVSPESLVHRLKDEPREETLVKQEINEEVKEEDDLNEEDDLDEEDDNKEEDLKEEVKEEDGDLKDSAVVFYSEQHCAGEALEVLPEHMSGPSPCPGGSKACQSLCKLSFPGKSTTFNVAGSFKSIRVKGRVEAVNRLR